MNKYTEEYIHITCEEYGIRNYTINDDGSIDVDGDIYIDSINLYELPLKFGNVTGNFSCKNNRLTSLKGCPNYVGNFYCKNNRLKSLIGGPSNVGGNYDCSENDLISLEGCPETIGGDLRCNNNQLISLYGCNIYTINGEFYISRNKLISLRYCPKRIIGGFDCAYNELLSLEYGPEYVEKDYSCHHNKLVTLKGAPNTINERFFCSNNNLTTLEHIPKSTKDESKYYFNMNKLISTKYTPSNIISSAFTSIGYKYRKNNNFPKEITDNMDVFNEIIKYQEDYKIWNNDYTLNKGRFKALIEDINNGIY